MRIEEKLNRLQQLVKLLLVILNAEFGIALLNQEFGILNSLLS